MTIDPSEILEVKSGRMSAWRLMKQAQKENDLEKAQRYGDLYERATRFLAKLEEV
jgi:hypothetical protein